ncbi:MAG TPA: hypothetical protein PK297_14590 [Spirochaetota bacterium]|nr:hypothetical protein [Spirochaetota bacterium]
MRTRTSALPLCVYIYGMCTPRTILFGLILLFAGLVTACDVDDAASKAPVVRIPVKRSTVAELVATLREAIRHGQHKVVQGLYTQASAAAVQRSIKTGLGTAGSIDEIILLEFEHPAAKTKAPIEIIEEQPKSLRLRLPSGNLMSCVLVDEGGVAIDVLASEGGEILLLAD